MRQGRASSSTPDYKTEPKAHSVNPAAVAHLGTMLGNHAEGTKGILPGAGVPLYRGRGLEAPMVGECSSNCGSQGKY